MFQVRAPLKNATSSLVTVLMGFTVACSSGNSGSGSTAAGSGGMTNSAANGSEAGSTAAGGATESSAAGTESTGVGGSAGATTEGIAAAGNSAGSTAIASAGTAGSSAPKTWYRPTTITNELADTAYATWKAAYFEDCQDGSWRVKWSDPTLTVSEGIGYGMLLTVLHDDQTIFDGLWKYYNANVDSHGLMHWKRSGCPGSAAGDNAATDAELDAAMALVMASRRWTQTPYLDEARRLIKLIQTYETTKGYDGVNLLKPGDSFGGYDCLNFSYFAPGYYRVFAEVVPEQAAFWTKLANDSYSLINSLANSATGLVPNWCDQLGATADAGPKGCTYYKKADQYGSDAARTPWRIATDFVWYGTPQAYVWLSKLTNWVKGVGIANVVDWYQLDGTAAGTNHSIVTVGAFANAAMAVDQQTADQFFQEVANMTPATSYYSGALRALYTLLPLGRFTPSGGK